MSSKERLIAVKNYLLERFNEPSTWRGITLIATAVGCYITPEMTEAIVAGGLFIAGLIGAASKDKIEKK
ncbi:hypothetical protein [Synechococcus phage BUCT-ZZ01]|nr:hypothetical protein [Synechococcus phage BUCT-ZZ01]